jgi:hypothetical protein
VGTLKNIDVYLEVGKKRTFAGAIDWPGWCRSGRDEASALGALFEYGARYADVLQRAGLEFRPPKAASEFRVVERLEGNATTDFGAPGLAPAADSDPVDEADLRHFQEILSACFRAFDTAVRDAAGKELRKGPRGGGRELEGVIRHVLGGDAGYLASIGWKLQLANEDDLFHALDRTRQAILSALGASARGEIAAIGPRGGVRWTPRYFSRRLAWHVLDHAWEIEDRILPAVLDSA